MTLCASLIVKLLTGIIKVLELPFQLPRNQQDSAENEQPRRPGKFNSNRSAYSHMYKRMASAGRMDAQYTNDDRLLWWCVEEGRGMGLTIRTLRSRCLFYIPCNTLYTRSSRRPTRPSLAQRIPLACSLIIAYFSSTLNLSPFQVCFNKDLILLQGMIVCDNGIRPGKFVGLSMTRVSIDLAVSRGHGGSGHMDCWCWLYVACNLYKA